MSIAERATAGIAEIPKADRPISERYRLAALDYVEKLRAAKLLEECKSQSFSQLVAKHIADHGPMPFNRAENAVQSSDGWRDYLMQMVEARYQADKAKAYRDVLEMRFAEWQSHEANTRAERKLSR